MRKILMGIALSLVFLQPLSALAYHHHRAPTPPPAPAPVPVPSSLQLGAAGATVGTIQAYFDGWTDDASCAPSGQTTFIYWENYGYSLDSVINGSQDANIQRFANGLCAGTVLSLFHEASGNWDPWDGTVGNNTPAKVVAAYQHIHDIIGNKVKYAWVMNDSDVPDQTGNRPSDYWPGSSYVDIVGVDGFDWGGMTFMQAIAPNFSILKAYATTYGKPIWVTSTGTAGNQAAWLTDAIAQAKANGIGAIIYFSINDGANFALTSQGFAAFHL